MGRAHAIAIRAFGGFDLVAAADPSPNARKEMQKVADTTPLFASADEMLQKERPDLVVVATPALYHCEPTIAALRAGAHVLCEKPFAVTLEEADRMIDTANSAGRMLLVDHQFRIHPRAQAALRLVRDGAIGDVIALRGGAKQNFSGSEILENGTHVFDLAMLFAGTPLWVSSAITVQNRPATVADIVDSKTVARLPSGLVVGERIHATIGFEKGTVLNAEFLGVYSGFYLQIIGAQGSLYVPLGANPGTAFLSRKSYANPNDPQSGWQPVSVELGKWGQQQNPFTYELWAQWLTNPDKQPMGIDGKHPMDANNGRRAIEIVHAVFESHFQESRRVALPMPQRDHPLERRLQALKQKA